MTWEYGSIVAVQTGQSSKPIRVLMVNGRLWNSGKIWDGGGDARNPDEMLNMLGAEGWELVSVVLAQDGLDDGVDGAPPQHRGRTFVYYLKRQRG